MTILDPGNPIPKQLKFALEEASFVAEGSRVCSAISGPPGVGKTYEVTKMLRAKNVPYSIVRGTGPALLLEAYRLRKGGVLLLDDADKLVTMGGITQANLMKQLLIPTLKRTLYNMTLKATANKANGNSDPNIPPPIFQTECGVIWLTNMKLDGKAVSAGIRDHISALTDRGLSPISITDDPHWLLNYVLHLVGDGKIRLTAGSKKELLTLDETNDVLDYFTVNAWRHETISIRTIEEIAFQRRKSRDWREKLDLKLRATPISTNPLPQTPMIVRAHRHVALPLLLLPPLTSGQHSGANGS